MPEPGPSKRRKIGGSYSAHGDVVHQTAKIKTEPFSLEVNYAGAKALDAKVSPPKAAEGDMLLFKRNGAVLLQNPPRILRFPWVSEIIGGGTPK